MQEIKYIFIDLTDKGLLEKCLHGKTQNPSESLNNIIWSTLPKSTFVMKETLQLGVHKAVACFNYGNIVKCKILSKLGVSPGLNCVKAMNVFVGTRIRKAEKAIEELEKSVDKI